MTVALVGADRQVLELGCSAGHVTRRLVDNGCTVVGIEIDPEMALAAEEFATSVIVADLDQVLPEELLEGRRFDTIVVGDVFEHLKRPTEVLRSLATLLEPGGRLIASVPNVTHVDVRLMLLTGLWRYQDGGLLDRTHLRFFDANGVAQLFSSGGFKVDRVERTIKGAFESELAPLFERDRIPADALSYALAGPESLTYQFVVVATPRGVDDPDTVGGAPGGAGGPSTAPGLDPREIATGATVLERLLEENEYLRVRVRTFEEDIEQVRWTLEHERAAHPRRRAQALAARLTAKVSSVVRR